MDLATAKATLLPICRSSGIKSLHAFGSVARGNARPDSDIDLVVTFHQPIGMFKLIALERRMSHALRCRVDLGTPASLHPLIRGNVTKDMELLYGE